MKQAPKKAHLGADVVRIEAEALEALAERIAGPMAEAFERALDLMQACQGRVVVTGMGKSGLVARKIAATLSSTGTPAMFLHPAEAVHGDLGMLVRGDVVIALSYSGETEEILNLLVTVKRLGCGLIAMTGENAQPGAPRRKLGAGSNSVPNERRPQPRTSQKKNAVSTLAGAAEVALDCSVAQEACSLGLAPTASTTTMLALGDALAVALAERRGFKEEHFAELHPGGKLGKKLAKVESLMHTGDAVPRVTSQTKMPDVIYEMSRKGLGVTTVVEGERLMGIISDGDLRRLLQKRGKEVVELTAGECMTRNPQTIAPSAFAATALNLMEQKKITSLVVTEAERLVGIVHLHDLWETEIL